MKADRETNPGASPESAGSKPDLKPFAVIGLSIVLFVVIVFVLYRGTSFMITSVFDNNNNAMEFAYSDDSLYRLDGARSVDDEAAHALTVKAVSVEADAIDYYGDWAAVLADAFAAGANTVQAQDVMPPGFYDALKAWNEAEGGRGDSGTLHLIQRVRLGDEAYATMADIVDGDAAGKLLEQAKFAVDVVHGSRILQGYFSDVSGCTIGCCAGWGCACCIGIAICCCIGG